MDNNLKMWRESGNYLPDFLKDFHDQKDFFKMMHEKLQPEEGQSTKDINWVAGQIYTIDYFLWYCAKFGYTMQKSRAKQNFEDLGTTLNQANNERDAAFSNILLGAMKKEEPPKD